MLRVGIVGTGEMGPPLVDRLVASGFDVAAYVRRAEVRAELDAAGITCVDSLTALGAGRDVWSVYVYRDEEVREVAFTDGLADAMEPGSVLLVLTTGSPRTVEHIDARVRARGVGVVDAPGSGGPAQVQNGTLTLFVGGADEHVAKCRPVLESYATQIVHFGALGAGQRVKLLNNLLFGANVELAVEAARVAAEFGIDPLLLARTLHSCSGANYALDLVAGMGSAEALVSAVGHFVHKDVLIARDVAAELGVDLGTIAAVTAPLVEGTWGVTSS